MRESTQNRRATSGQWAQQAKAGMDRQQEAQTKRAGEQGDERTPDQPIGQVAYAERQRQLDEGKPGRDRGNELSAGTDPTRKKTGEF